MAKRKTPRRVPRAIKRTRSKGRISFEQERERETFVTECLARRLTYAQLAKAVAERYGLKLKSAYAYLGNYFRRLRKQLQEQDDEDVMGVFYRVIVSLEQSVRAAKADKDWRAAISGDMALAKLYGFDKGNFLAAIAEARKRKMTKKVEAVDLSNTESLASRMQQLSNEQLSELLSYDKDFEEVIDGDNAKKAAQEVINEAEKQGEEETHDDDQEEDDRFIDVIPAKKGQRRLPGK